MLAAVREILAAMGGGDPGLAGSLERRGPRSGLSSPGTPVLNCVTLTVNPEAYEELLHRLSRAAGSADPLRPPFTVGSSPLAILETAIREDLSTLALPDRLSTLARLAVIPLLRECATRLSSEIPPDWEPGYCPVCAAWPALAETRGIERARRLRCVRCAADWAGELLCCCFCGERDHARLGSLTPEAAGTRATADTCFSCRGYLKTVTTLAPLPAEDLLLMDFQTVELDLAARDAGFVRPPGLGAPLDVRITAPPAR